MLIEKFSHELKRGKGRPRCFDRKQALLSALDIFWRRGYEPASIAELCQAMQINPPSLYATFGNKAKLFLEAVQFYEKTYWEAPINRFLENPDIYQGIDAFFRESAHILLSPDCPCGCMVVLATINISENEQEIIKTIKKMRSDSKRLFVSRIQQAINDKQLPHNIDVSALAGAFNTMIEGLSIQARDGLSQKELEQIAAHAVYMLPNWKKHLLKK